VACNCAVIQLDVSCLFRAQSPGPHHKSINSSFLDKSHSLGRLGTSQATIYFFLSRAWSGPKATSLTTRPKPGRSTG